MRNFRLNGVTGHRGNPERAPENTLESFEDAMKLGADFIETDVHLTRDGRLMLCHDADALRTCGVSMKFAESDAAELRKLDASRGFNQSHPEAPFAPTRIPFLEELFELARRYPDVRISLQPKCPEVAAICRAVEAAGFVDRVGFNDGNLEYMKTAKQLIPSAVIFYDTGSVPQLEEAIEISRGLGFYGIVAHFDSLNAERVAAIRAQGLEPGVWTVNDPAEIRRFLAMGVFRVYSDCLSAVLRLKTDR